MIGKNSRNGFPAAGASLERMQEGFKKKKKKKKKEKKKKRS